MKKKEGREERRKRVQSNSEEKRKEERGRESHGRRKNVLFMRIWRWSWPLAEWTKSPVAFPHSCSSGKLKLFRQYLQNPYTRTRQMYAISIIYAKYPCVSILNFSGYVQVCDTLLILNRYHGYSLSGEGKTFPGLRKKKTIDFCILLFPLSLCDF